MFGVTPAYGFFIRHAKGVRMHNVKLDFLTDEQRPAFVIEQSENLSLQQIDAARTAGGATFVLKEVTDFRSRDCGGLGDRTIGEAAAEKF